MHRTFLAVLGIAALAVGGCGGDDKKDSTPAGDTKQEEAKPLTKADYIAKADDICRDGKKATQPFEDKLDALPDDPDVEDIAPILEDALVELRKTRERLGALPAPNEDKTTLDAYYASADKTLAIAAQLQEAADAGDEPKAKKIVESNQSNNAEQERLAKEYGFKACAD